MDGLQNVINIVEFPSLLHKQQLDLKNGYQQSLLSVDDFAGNMAAVRDDKLVFAVNYLKDKRR